ncbi:MULTISPECIES: DNA-3-methyladenine glycosylase 2 family protein [Paenibacillus]|uniref:DNA-3-methyladenine glycosylase family protein n=1 Tax=Paenibacillus TaxID=44249 RepID=UPI002FE3F58B
MSAPPIQYFDYGQEQIDYLKRADPVLGEAIARLGRPERPVNPDLFTALVHAIIGQLISTKAVNTIWGRMQERFGGISPASLASRSADEIQGCGMTMKKAICIWEIARKAAEGELDFSGFSRLGDEEVILELMRLKGVGRWTAEMLLLHSLERPDVVSWGDLAIRRGMMRLYGLTSLTKPQFDAYRARYSPYGSVASIYLWELSV